jgi:hypothetical protein
MRTRNFVKISHRLNIRAMVCIVTRTDTNFNEKVIILISFCFERLILDEKGDFHTIQNEEDFALTHDSTRNIHTVYVVGEGLSSMAQWKVVTTFAYLTTLNPIDHFDVVQESVVLKPI